MKNLDVGCLDPTKFDPVLVKYRDSIDDFLISTYALRGFSLYSLSNDKSADEQSLILVGMSPNKIFDAGTNVHQIQDTKTTLGLSEQLYTARGSQGVSMLEEDA